MVLAPADQDGFPKEGDKMATFDSRKRTFGGQKNLPGNLFHGEASFHLPLMVPIGLLLLGLVLPVAIIGHASR